MREEARGKERQEVQVTRVDSLFVGQGEGLQLRGVVVGMVVVEI